MSSKTGKRFVSTISNDSQMNKDHHIYKLTILHLHAAYFPCASSIQAANPENSLNNV